MKQGACPICKEPLKVPNVASDRTWFFCTPCFERLIDQTKYNSPIPQGLLAIDLVKGYFEDYGLQKLLLTIFPKGLPKEDK